MINPLRFPLLLTALIILAAAFVPASAQRTTAPDPRIELVKKLPPGVEVDDLRATPIPGLYELRRGADIGYVSSDGLYYISGEIIELKSRVSITERSRSDIRNKLIAKVPESEMLIYGPASAPYTITVFTDVECGYCRQLHRDIPELNRLGVRVRYMFFPRSDPDGSAWKTAEAIWCAQDRKDALTKANQDQGFRTKQPCGASPIARQRQLGEELGVRGTPSIVTSNGKFLPGYLPPEKLLAALKAP